MKDRGGSGESRYLTSHAADLPDTLSRVDRDALIVFEDAHLLVVDKPAGWATHSPDPFAGEGVYDWLRHREPRWAGLAIIHRLDKVTSGLLVFAKTPLACRSLTAQFTRREVRKVYRLLTASPPAAGEFTVRSRLIRRGERYVSDARARDAVEAVTRFRVLHTNGAGLVTLEAEPLTGRTHQIRVHAAENGFPILGDTLYGAAAADRVCLHAAALAFAHPVTGAPVHWGSARAFESAPADALRQAVVDPAQTNAWRVWHGGSDGPTQAGWYVERWGDWLVSATGGDSAGADGALRRWCRQDGLRGCYEKSLHRDLRGLRGEESSPRLRFGEAAPEAFSIRENGVQFEIRFGEGGSVGLFLDQRDNRRRLLVNHVAAGFTLFPGGAAGTEVLNTFAYTCGFSVCAAKAGARTTSLDLSRKYLDWGRRNFALNDLDPTGHDFIYGDTFDWLRRLAKRGRRFDAVLLDPPTFSTSKAGGAFRAEADYGRLVEAALPVVRPGGVLFAATNAAALTPAAFLDQVRHAVLARDRRIRQQHYVPQPPDFPASRAEPAYLKTVWLRLD